MEIYRIYVEKRAPFAAAAQAVLADLLENALLAGLTNVRLFNRYDVTDITPEAFLQAKETIFSEPNTDTLLEALPPAPQYLAVELLPGQFDQRADSAAQCVQLLTGTAPRVRCATVYAFFGLGEAELERAKKYIINPVEAREASLAPLSHWESAPPPPADVPLVEGFTQLSAEALAAYHKEQGFAMTIEDLAFVQGYFQGENRDPSFTELKVIDTYWSDHCRHTTFLTALTEITVGEGAARDEIEKALGQYFALREKFDRTGLPTLMDLATMPPREIKARGKLEDLDESEEINACSLRVNIKTANGEEEWLVLFKNETHNHPTEIEPFGGAATCLGGAIRDPLSGRAYVYQAMRVTGSGDPRATLEETLPNKLTQRKITLGAAAGYSSYGNQIGLATGQVSEVYHEGYRAKRLEIGAVVGAVKADRVRREQPAPGDCIVLVGGATGRDGCGGATGSSKAHTNESLQACGAEVQKGNAPTERKLQRLFLNPEASLLIKRCNDFGAGGVCVAVGELADGLDINLDRVPKKYEGLDGTELAISESQERMAVVLAPGDVAAFLELAGQENLSAVPIATVTDTGRMRMLWRGEPIVNLSRAFLNTNGVQQRERAFIREANIPSLLTEKPAADNAKKALLTALSSLNVTSQKGLGDRFDSTIGAGTVLLPLGGKTQLTPAAAMAALIPAQTDTATIMSWGFHPVLCGQSPFYGGLYAVVESLCKLTCAGADFTKARLTQQEYFERLRHQPERWGRPAGALLGSLTAQLQLDIPAIGGKDSMSGSFMELDVPPTLVCFALATEQAGRLISPEFKKENSWLCYVDFQTENELPVWENLKQNYQAVYTAIGSGEVLSAAPILEGGLAAAAAKMALGNGIGCTLTLPAEGLFCYRPGRMLLEVQSEEAARRLGVIAGRTGGEAITIGGESVSLAEAEQAFTKTLAQVFPPQASAQTGEFPTLTYKRGTAAGVRYGRPRVLIPVFPGTNCELDSQQAFARAGAKTEIFVLRNANGEEIAQSLLAFKQKLDNSQIFMLPGGFSAGDEPDGSGKFIATFLRSPQAMEAVHGLLQRQGLILGICNGFQALIKTGLLPGGQIQPALLENDATLTFNTLHRHISTVARIRYTGAKSPWLNGLEPGEEFLVPLSHGEGRFAAPAPVLAQLAANGQIATQYVNEEGKATGNPLGNPNGSQFAVEGIVSPDGRIFGKMGHTERTGINLYRNLPGQYDMPIFLSGTKYFL